MLRSFFIGDAGRSEKEKQPYPHGKQRERESPDDPVAFNFSGKHGAQLCAQKNTDRLFDCTFGFAPEERERGIVSVESVRDLVLANADVIPTDTLIGYLEIGGPKLGRDYSDHKLERLLRESFRYLRGAWSAA